MCAGLRVGQMLFGPSRPTIKNRSIFSMYIFWKFRRLFKTFPVPRRLKSIRKRIVTTLTLHSF